MNDLSFNHNERGFPEAFGVKRIDFKKFLLDVEENGNRKISKEAEYIWNHKEVSLEMKLAALIAIGMVRGSGPQIRAIELSGEDAAKLIKRLTGE